MDKETPIANIEDPDFNSWTTEELFDHLMDLYIIPYEEEFSKWKSLRGQMLYMCKQSYVNRTI
jgi:hypothetical protein